MNEVFKAFLEREQAYQGKTCKDQYDLDNPCQRNAEVMCSRCNKPFCLEHVVNVEVTIGPGEGEDRVYCRDCVTTEFIRLDEENSELKNDLRMLGVGGKDEQF
jgi:hypothetical protein